MLFRLILFVCLVWFGSFVVVCGAVIYTCNVVCFVCYYLSGVWELLFVCAGCMVICCLRTCAFCCWLLLFDLDFVVCTGVWCWFVCLVVYYLGAVCN